MVSKKGFLIRFLINLSLIVLPVFDSRADCLSCWILEPVTVKLINGDSLNGYIRWNDQWLPDSGRKEDFGDSFLDKVIFHSSYYGFESVEFYKEVYEFDEKLEFEGFFTTNKNKLKIPLGDIISLYPRDDNRNGKLTGAGEMITLTQKSFDFIQNSPFVYYRSEGTVSETHFLGYNQNIDLDSIKTISAQNDLFLKPSKYEDMDVIIIMISWD